MVFLLRALFSSSSHPPSWVLYGLRAPTVPSHVHRAAVTAFLHQYYLESDLQYFYDNYFRELSGTPIASKSMMMMMMTRKRLVFFAAGVCVQ